MNALLDHLLRAPAATAAARDVSGWWRLWSKELARFERPIEAAIAGGLAADRLGFAFAAGYHAALRSLLPELTGDRLVSLCATEVRGAHPRSIETTLSARGESFVLSGSKRWSTLASAARELLVFARIGSDAAGRVKLRIARVPADAPGVSITLMAPTPFAPEIPHSEITFHEVAVPSSALLEGDGWERWVKPFRTVEDLHVHGALLGYVIGVARRHQLPRGELERLLALVVATVSLSALPPAAAETQLALAGLLGEITRAVSALTASFERVEPAERARWERDQGLFEVASAARAARTARAWERVSGVEMGRSES